MHFSFSGCGFLGVYHLGVVSCLRSRAPQLLPHITSVGGASAGALAAVFLVSPQADINAAFDYVLKTSESVQRHYLGPFDPRYDVLGELEIALNSLLPDDVHIAASGRLRVSLSVLTDRRRLVNDIVSQFSSKDDLIQALKATCFIPLFSGVRLPLFRDQYCMDGGFTDNLPSNMDTTTVSPFSGESDICPLDTSSSNLFNINWKNTSFQLTLQNMYRLSKALMPSDCEFLRHLKQQGYEDCLRYLSRQYVQKALDSLSLASLVLNDLDRDSNQTDSREQTCVANLFSSSERTVTASSSVVIQCETSLATTVQCRCGFDQQETQLVSSDCDEKPLPAVVPSVGQAVVWVLDMVRRGLVYVKDGTWCIAGWCGDAAKVVSVRALRSWEQLYKLLIGILAGSESYALPTSVRPSRSQGKKRRVRSICK